MSRNDELLYRQDTGDVKKFEKLVTKAVYAKRKIETGFLELAESIYEINKTRLYRVKYKTFAEFCDEEQGFSRQTIYVYLSILKLIAEYNAYINRDKAICFGHKKMRHITEGISSIEKLNLDNLEQEKRIKEIFMRVAPEMPSTEIEAIIEDIISIS